MVHHVNPTKQVLFQPDFTDGDTEARSSSKQHSGDFYLGLTPKPLLLASTFLHVSKSVCVCVCVCVFIHTHKWREGWEGIQSGWGCGVTRELPDSTCISYHFIFFSADALLH